MRRLSVNWSLGMAAGTALVLELIVLFFLLRFLRSLGVTSPNYQGIQIPVAAGISFPATLFLVYGIERLAGCYPGETAAVYLAAVTGISLLGLIDDLLGTRDTLGFRGHIRKLLKGELTTGGLKAVGGGLVALYTSVMLFSTWQDILINTLLIALFTNLINLLDLRPGRAIKGFLTVFVILLFATDPELFLFGPVVAAVIAYFPFDLKAKAMMGDSGSNILGFTLGVVCATGSDMPARLGVLGFLILVHLFTERYSLTEIIERWALLRFLDNLGRGGERRGQ